MIIDAQNVGYQELNEVIRTSGADVTINNCIGQRFIAAGLNNLNLKINGIPGNALGAYLDGAEITVYGNAQDAVGDTMNDGKIVVHGNIGDAPGYAMRGGSIYVKGNAGYRAGIHMKAYDNKLPVMVIGGSAGSFLGEYQAGGIIIVLGLGCETPAVGYFCGTGMHGGKMFLRGNYDSIKLPAQVNIQRASDEELKSIEAYINEFSRLFDVPADEIMSEKFYVLTPNSKNPYKQLYVPN